MKSSLCLSIMLVICMSSCDSDVNSDNIPINDLLSVSSVISPQDSIFHVYLFRASALGTVANSESSLVKNAQVVITDGINGDTLTFNDNNSRYEAVRKNLILKPLNTYFLTIETSTGKTLKASCTIPPLPQVPNLEGQKDGEDFIFTVSWENPTGFKYFTLAPLAEGTFEYNYPDGPRTVVLSARLLEPVAFPSENQINHNFYEGIVPAAFMAENPKLKLFLRNIEESLYHHLKTYQEYEEWQSNNDGNLIPNFQEPQPIYSNIDGGVGVFGSYNQSITEIEID